MIDLIRNTWNFLTIDNFNYNVKSKIFNSISIIVIFYLASMALFNMYYLGQLMLGWIVIGATLAQGGVYYLGRFKGHYKLGFLIFSTLSYPILAINFYLNDGIEGPSLYIFMMIHIIIMALSHKKNYHFWILYNFLFFSILFYIDNYYPQIIPATYDNPDIKFIDHELSYLTCLVGIFAIIVTLKKSYLIQKKKTETKSRALGEANYALKKSNDQKDKIIALISHDLKNPLLSITQILKLIKNKDLNEEEMKMAQEELYTMTNNTQKMLDNILDWATFELQNREVSFTENHVADICKSFLSVYHTLAKQKGIHFIIDYEDNPIIKTDVDRFSLILRNLIQNAIKFTKSGGCIKFLVKETTQHVSVMVEDSGIGISREKINTLFEMDIKTTYGTQREKGTGLGLSLCKENSKKIGAQLSVESEEGKGTTFTLTLPH
ncbi:HAMP domain-containing sensor histidine kinase [Echinicola jeungdonensis]|uniref:histidine kinase n=1 Tax=Echinicola jeungdonensis TaxID=709343 RepID=A0ABV5J7Q0_9BACT|nr:HAMP domain-containing sensor histidine kinase [Echinicola jeungdonensis]MDN3669689.1 HAMP domain-containing sensor histidine kinase [Echinicola jeungdonensis]